MRNSVRGRISVYPLVLPLGALLRPWRRHIVSAYMKTMCWGILTLFKVGGARFERRGTVPTGEPCVILMNHQSLLDIVTTTLMGHPFVPAFVPRRRYARWYIPLVGASSSNVGRDPKRDRRRRTIRRAGLTHKHGILIFPEEHRASTATCALDGGLSGGAPRSRVCVATVASGSTP
jgi:1-acyl-sn-glycerol-3-phosphate acyltransferase